MAAVHILISLLFASCVSQISGAFVSNRPSLVGMTNTKLKMAADSEVSFSELDGSNVRVGIIKTRWNDEHVNNLVSGIKKSLEECKVEEDNIFETEVPGSFELPLAARYLALSGTVDAIICCGVLIKGETLHFEYICSAVSDGLMTVGLQTATPVIFGVLTCLNEEQVISRSTGTSNHGEDWGKTAVEMALLRTEALGMKDKMGSMGFGNSSDDKESGDGKKEKFGFF